MAVKAIECTIKGLSPLIMHQFPMVPIAGLEKKSPEEQAEVSAYRCPDTNELYIPGVAIQRCLVNAATYSKGKGRGSLQKPVAACLIVSPERALLGTKKFDIDARSVVIPATHGRIIRYRPRLDKWQVSITLEYDDVLLNSNDVRHVVDDAGSRVGLLDFRPACKGPFGRFIVTSWKD